MAEPKWDRSTLSPWRKPAGLEKAAHGGTLADFSLTDLDAAGLEVGEAQLDVKAHSFLLAMLVGPAVLLNWPVSGKAMMAALIRRRTAVGTECIAGFSGDRPAAGLRRTGG